MTVWSTVSAPEPSLTSAGLERGEPGNTHVGHELLHLGSNSTNAITRVHLSASRKQFPDVRRHHIKDHPHLCISRY